MKKDLVSVVVTSYNHKEYIKECLNSIFHQNYKKIELFILDDHSTDGSMEIIQSFIKESPFPTEIVINEKNLGVSINRNQAFSKIEGEFLLFVDSDNYLPSCYIKKMVETMQKKKADIVYGNLVNIETKEFFLKSKYFDLQQLLENNYIDNCSLIRVKKIGNIRYDISLSRKKLEDYDFILNLIINNQCVPVYDPQVNLNYRVLENSISRFGDHQTTKYYYEVYLSIIQKYLDKLPLYTFTALKSHIFLLESRLDEFIRHHNDVTKYVLDLEDIKLRLLENIDKIENKLIDERELKEEYQEKYKKQLNIIKEISRNNSNQKQQIQKLSYDIHLIQNSKSYKLGNLIINPVSKGIHIFKSLIREKKIKKIIKKFYLKVGQCLRIPELFLNKLKRRWQRKNNNYVNPSRVLIYVIYNEKGDIAKYKKIFLAALSEVVNDVLIVVNGELNKKDLIELSGYGKVELRDNTGYDVAGFRHGILKLAETNLFEYDELVLVNDTNIGPFENLSDIFTKMSKEKLDFWGISYGEEQEDFTGLNPYGYIPKHIQSYFMVIEKSLFTNPKFLNYWQVLTDTNSRESAVARYETVFTKKFSDMGYKHGSLIKDSSDSSMYIHPLDMIRQGSPIVKYAALKNYSDDIFHWQGLERRTEVPELLEYIKNETQYPYEIIEIIMKANYNENKNHYVLIIDGVENIIPQCTRYRVENKKEQLESVGICTKVVNNSDFKLKDAEYASAVIIYRAPYSDLLNRLIDLCKRSKKIVLFDIDDLVFDTKFTNQLTYTRSLNDFEKSNYDGMVNSYGALMSICDGVVTSTTDLKIELNDYTDLVILNRNLASEKLIKISENSQHNYSNSDGKVKIGYFSGSITHNENFNLIKYSILNILNQFENVEIHVTGFLDLPKELEKYRNRFVKHDYVDWLDLPNLVSEVDINIAPLKDSIFNRAKSEIKWIEASLVKVPTIASNIGAFKEMIKDDYTGILANEDEWETKLGSLIIDSKLRRTIGENAYNYVIKKCVTKNNRDELVVFLNENKIQ